MILTMLNRFPQVTMPERLADFHQRTAAAVGVHAQKLQGQLSLHQTTQSGLCGELVLCGACERSGQGQPQCISIPISFTSGMSIIHQVIFWNMFTA